MRATLLTICGLILLMLSPAWGKTKWNLILPGSQAVWVYQAGEAGVGTPVSFPLNAVYRQKASSAAIKGIQKFIPQHPISPLKWVDTRPSTSKLDYHPVRRFRHAMESARR